MLRTSHRLSVPDLRLGGRVIFNAENIPPQMPVLKGGYRLVAILGGTTWHYGQVVHNTAFYMEMLANVRKFNYRIEALISIHPVTLGTIPLSDLIRL